MKRILFLLMSFVLLISCSSSDDEVSQEDWARQNQEVMYNKVVSTIVGHWKGYQHYNNTSPIREHGWEDISYISWNQEYIFKEDGTCVDIRSSNLIYEGTYSFRKNEEYLKYPTSECELFIIMVYNDGREVEKAIWIDDYKNEYMHISTSFFGVKPLYTSGGEASIRYKKF